MSDAANNEVKAFGEEVHRAGQREEVGDDFLNSRKDSKQHILSFERERDTEGVHEEGRSRERILSRLHA